MSPTHLRHLHQYRAVPGLMTLLASIILSCEIGMAFGKTIVVASEFNGKLIDGNGVPQAGVTVVRKWKRSAEDKAKVQQTVTGSDGSFRFEAVTATSILAYFLPGTPVMRQDISAQAPEGKVELWKAIKTNFLPNGELEGRPLRFVCQIDKNPNDEAFACQETH